MKPFDGRKPSSFSRHHALLCNSCGVQGCLQVTIEHFVLVWLALPAARWLGLYKTLCWCMDKATPRRADIFGPQNAVPDSGEWMIDFIKSWFSKICCWDFASLQSCLGQIWKFWNLEYLLILSNSFHVHQTVVLPFYLGTKGGDMKHQRETYKNTLVSIDHVLHYYDKLHVLMCTPSFFLFDYDENNCPRNLFLKPDPRNSNCDCNWCLCSLLAIEWQH